MFKNILYVQTYNLHEYEMRQYVPICLDDMKTANVIWNKKHAHTRRWQPGLLFGEIGSLHTLNTVNSFCDGCVDIHSPNCTQPNEH